MKDLVKVVKGKMVVDSRDIAKHFNKIHRDVIRAIENLGCSTEFKLRNFAHRDYIVRGVSYPKYMLTRDGFSFLCMGFTGKKAAVWKEKYISAFNMMEKRLLQVETNEKDQEWLGTRQIGKIARKEETDSIKEFVEYATKQGSKNAKFYYKHVTNATYRALGLMAQRKPKLRDEMNIYQISELLLAERLAGESLKKYMELERNYKDIYESVAHDLIEFSQALKIGSKQY